VSGCARTYAQCNTELIDDVSFMYACAAAQQLLWQSRHVAGLMLLLCWRRIPEEPSNKYHARHLIHREHSESSSLLRSYSPEQLIADLQCSQGAAEDLYSSAAVGNCEFQENAMG
jgi:hypothetical protein